MSDRAMNVMSMLMSNASMIPILLVWFGGIAFGAGAWRKHPLAARLLLSGIIVQLLAMCIFVLSQVLWRFPRTGGDMAQYFAITQLLGWARGFITAVGYALLVAAVFADREKALQNVDLNSGQPVRMAHEDIDR